MPAQTPDVELVSPGDGLVRRLLEHFGDLKRADILAPVTIITTSYYSSFFLRRALAQAAAHSGAGLGQDRGGPAQPGRGLFNVEFTRIEDVADMLAALGQDAGQAERLPLSSLVAGEIVRHAATALRDGGPLGRTRDHPSFHRALHRTLDDLRAAGIPASELPRLGGHFHELGAAASEYQLLIRGQGFEDRADVAARAAERLASSGLPDRLGRVIVVLAIRPAPQYRALYRTLMWQAGVRTLLCLTGSPVADGPLVAFAGAGRNTVTRALGKQAGASAEHAGGPPPAVFVSAPGPAAEARWLASNVLRLARDDGVLFSEMAVLYADRAYGPRLEEAFRFAGIPVSGPASSRPADWPEGRFIAGLLDALKPGPGSGLPSLSRDAVTGWLTGATVRDPATLGPAPSARWDAISRLANVTGGAEGWDRGLEALRARLHRQADRAPWDDEQGGDLAGRSASAEAVSAAALQEFVRRLAEKGRAPAPGWKAYAGWLRKLVDEFQVPAPAGDAASAERRERVGMTLDRLEELEALGSGPPTFERFSQVLRDELDRPAGRSGRLGSGVFLAHYSEVAGAPFRVVHIAGLAEGQVIAHDNPDPLLPDSVRERLNEARAGQGCGLAAPGGPALELRQDRRAAQLLELEAAALSGQRRFFSWPRSQAGATRESEPAEWLVEQARRTAGNPGLQSRELNTPDPSMGDGFLRLDRDEHVLAPASSAAHDAGDRSGGWTPLRPESAPDAHWRDVASVAAWSRALKYQDHALVSDPDGPVAPALRLESSRYGESWTEWDGNLTGNVQRRTASTFPVASPTRYETWATCPFRYFLGYEIEVSPTERPEELLELTPAERGTLVHAILERFVKARQETPSAAGTAEMALMDEAASGEFARFVREEHTGHPALWEVEKRSLRRSLKAWLAQDSDARSRSGAEPWSLELAFGGEAGTRPPVEVGLPDGTRLLFRGRIDRVDLSPDGRVFVYDYKTGRPDKFGSLGKDSTKKGTLLQLPVYARAARQAVEQDGSAARSVSASYWPVLRTVALALKPRPGDFDEQNADARLREVAGVIASGVDGGVFPARPGPARGGRESARGSPFENCEYCPFDRVCTAPGRRARLWERKRGSHAALAPYVSLAEGAAAQAGGEAED